MTRILSWALVCGALAAASCSASYPVSPSGPPPLAAVHVHLRTSAALRPGINFSLIAYAVDGDGVYKDVSTTATWTSSDPAVARLIDASTGRLRAIEAGSAQIFASYEGFSGSVSVDVGPQPSLPSLPFLSVTPAAVTVGGSSPQYAQYHTTNTSFGTAVERAASWTSSDPSVVSVGTERNGLVVLAGHAPGTVRITATYEGHSASYRLSVPPRRAQ